MYSTILVPIDGSSGADDAVSRAFEFARTFGADVHVLYVVDTGVEPAGLGDQQRENVRQPAEKRGREVTTRVRERATELGLEATRTVREGVPYRTILEYAGEHDVDLIAMGTHGRTGADRVRLGSTAERVIARADVPVLAARLTGGELDVEAVDYDRVVIPTDGSDAAERAAQQGLEIAESYGATVYVPYVIDTTTYDLEDAPRSIVGLLKEGGQNATEAIADDARERGLTTKADVLRGVPDEELLEYVDGVDGDLVAMGTRGRGGATGDLLGSTTARLLRRTSRPILAVR